MSRGAFGLSPRFNTGSGGSSAASLCTSSRVAQSSSVCALMASISPLKFSFIDEVDSTSSVNVEATLLSDMTGPHDVNTCLVIWSATPPDPDPGPSPPSSDAT
jgi:hypothetical protein